MAERHEAAVIGAGPAGLAAARELQRRGVDTVVLERGDRPGHCWARLYDSLRLHTGRHLSTLPGMRFPRGTPLFPARDDFVAYLAAYAERHVGAIRTGADVARARHDAGGWTLGLRAGHAIRARALVIATGIISNPAVPDIAGRDGFRGDVLHSVDYRRPGPFAGRRVLVVGVGNSGGEIASELAAAGVDTSIAVRSGNNVVPLTLAGVPIQYLSVAMRALPRRAQETVAEVVRRAQERRRGPPVLPRPPHSPLDQIPLIGFSLVDAIRAGRVTVRPGLDRFTRTGVRFSDGAEGDFDAVILATGFRPALGVLAGRVRTDGRGFALRRDRVASADVPDLFLIGHNYDAAGGIRNIARDARLVGAAVSGTARSRFGRARALPHYR
jgi:putative flavoprotein involved in K+ transport